MNLKKTLTQIKANPTESPEKEDGDPLFIDMENHKNHYNNVKTQIFKYDVDEEINEEESKKIMLVVSNQRIYYEEHKLRKVSDEKVSKYRVELNEEQKLRKVSDEKVSKYRVKLKKEKLLEIPRVIIIALMVWFLTRAIDAGLSNSSKFILNILLSILFLLLYIIYQGIDYHSYEKIGGN